MQPQTLRTRRRPARRRPGRRRPAPARSPRSSGRGALCGLDHADHGRADRSAAIRTIRSRANSCRRSRARRAAAGARRSDRRRCPSPVAGIVHRYPDRVLLKLVCTSARSIAASASAARSWGPGGRRAVAGGARRRARLYPRPSGDLGSDPHRRRSAGAVAAPPRARSCGARRDRSCQDRAPAYARAVVDPERITDEIVAALKTRGKATYVALHANHPRELTRRGGGLRPPHRRRHPDGEPDRAAARASTTMPSRSAPLMRPSSRTGSSPIISTMAISRPAPAHLRTAIATGQALMRACAAACRDCASRPMCSTFQAGRQGADRPAIHFELRGAAAGATGCEVRATDGTAHRYPSSGVPRRTSATAPADLGVHRNGEQHRLPLVARRQRLDAGDEHLVRHDARGCQHLGAPATSSGHGRPHRPRRPQGAGRPAGAPAASGRPAG